jgi:hypothetical protein
MTEQRYSCQTCDRSDLSLTANGRVRSHAADGRRAGPTNPHCGGGSDWPIENTDFHTHEFEFPDSDPDNGSFCTVDGCGMAEPEDEDQPGGATSVLSQPNPHRAPLPRGRLDEIAEQQATHPEGWGQPLVETGEGSSATSPTSSTGTTGGPTTVRSSTPGTTASATSASNRSTKATSSGASGTESTSMSSASKTGSAASPPPAGKPPVNEATAFLNGAGGGAAAAGTGNAPKSNAVPRDRWGRYLLPHPETGRTQPWTRATTLASSVADTFALSMWSQRMVAKGMTVRPDLYALASSFDVSADKDDLNAVCEQAKSAAGDKVAANLGTAMHAFTAAVDQGEKPNVPPSMQADVDAYVAALAEIGLEIVPHMIERRTVITSLKEGVAGTFDRVYLVTKDITLTVPWSKAKLVLRAGEYILGDLKTGRDLSYGWGEIAIQEALYAHGINDHGVWDDEAEQWVEPHTLEDVNVRLLVRTDVGVVVHLPVQKTKDRPACTVFAVNIADGWEATQLCTAVRQWRRQKKLATPIEVVDQPAPVTAPEQTPVQEQKAAQTFRSPTAAQLVNHPSVAGEKAPQPAPAPVPHLPTWEERGAVITTKAEASAIFGEMRKQVGDIGVTRLNAVVKLMQDRLKSLVENAG